MNQTLLAFSLGAAGLILAATTVHSAPQCGTRDLVLGQLTEKYGETRRSMGLAANNGVVEVFASPASGSWTITVTLPDGVMCLVASGHSYEAVTEELPARGRKI
ncbi:MULTISPECIES: hypothetical protein [Pseudomonadota]|uniref:Uncharacterized protein n=1 Tax=Pseudotabrizicola alkalilacus TaxID=2305252 RepID=A0A411Z126_9RHOB|nr:MULTISPECIES: hypothetical protein [Pseudomonadota]MDO9604970.1 hypothetical protein [Hydrogenophaga sp.]RGP36779.1 hypothetical protein D1012_14125 [Pseudotabrizicola alkalilacus]